jgi:hypothetical protein
MFRRNKIAFVVSAVCCLACCFQQLFAKENTKKKITKQPVTVGFKTGRSFLFEPSPSGDKKYNLRGGSFNRGVTINTPIFKRIKAETGINYSLSQPGCCKTFGNKIPERNSSSLSIPVTAQYYLLPQHCRLQPYCGIGMQYGFKTYSSSILNGDAYKTNNMKTQYVSILFVQGITFEINTKIQLTQSFHFIPEKSDKIIGFDIGIGFCLP